MTTVLRYTGNEEGVPFVMGVPARNLTDEDIEALVGGRYGDDRGAVKRTLVKSGMYKAVTESASPSTAKKATTDKAEE